MKKIIFLICAGFCLFLFDCSSKDEDIKATAFESQGVILGLDEALCACCGNWRIEIDGGQLGDQFVELPADSDIDLANATFPLEVNLNWTRPEAPPCNFIVIDAIELR